jgi:hypothetical protein
MNKLMKSLLVKTGILRDFFSVLLKFRLWWAMPIIILLTVFLIVLAIAGHTGIAALIYPFF